MSLVGNLEDLGLGEILQIVSLSRKSGMLALHSRGREGRIVFRNGMVTQAQSSALSQSLGEILIQKGVIDLSRLRQALAHQEQEGFRERLGEVFVKKFGVSAAAVEEVVRDQIEKVVYSLFAWAEGTFDFELQDTTETVDNAKMDPMQFMLDQGLNPQFLAMEGSRIVDERRHRGEELDEELPAPPHQEDENVDFAFDLLEETPPPPVEVPAPVMAPVPSPPAPLEAPLPESPPREDAGFLILVDDDASTRTALSAIFQAEGYRVQSHDKGEDTLISIDGAYRSGKKPVAVVDLVMPRMDGTGMLGGLELLELVHNNFSDVPVIVLSDYRNADAEKKVREMGYPFLLKPRPSELDAPGILEDLSRRLLAAVGGRGAVASVAAVAGNCFNIGDELRLELGEEIEPVEDSQVRSSTGIGLLRGMLEELNNPSLGGGIILLVLRFASEFMNRAVVFMVKKEEIAGLGQFGISDTGESADIRVRNMRIPREESSVFTRVIDSQAPMKVQPDDSTWNTYLLDQLKEGVPREVFLGPIVSEGKVVAVLYGDNLPEHKAIGDTESLEIFLSQAGLAMEKALLQRRLKDRGQVL